MAEEIAENCSVMTLASSAVVPPNNWWDLQRHSLSALSSWCNNNNNNNNTSTNNNDNSSNTIHWHHRNNHHRNHGTTNPNSNSDEDMSISTSFTNASNHSGLTVESSSRVIEPVASSDDLIRPTEPQAGSDSHMWSHVLLNGRSNGDLHSHHQDVGENFLDMLSSKSIFESDYLKKLDTSNNNNWDHQFSNSSSPNSLNNFVNNNNNSQPHSKLINNFNSHDHHHHHYPTAMNHLAATETERLSKLSNLISNWSIAPPESADQNPQISLRSSSVDHDHHHHHQYLKETFIGDENPGLFAPCFAQNNDPKIEINEASEARASLRRSFNSSYHHHHHQHVGLNNGTSNNIMGSGANNGKLYNNDNYGMINSLNSYNPNSGGDDSAKNFADVISFSGRVGNPLLDIQGILNNNNKATSSKSLSLSDSKKQGRPTPARSSGKGKINSTSNSTSEAKKIKRSEDSNSETSTKRPRQEDSTASSAKIQVPKVKLTERITALQQIVSPFGKTDTASVLLEAIQYIKFLQEQVQLLSNPYMKTNPHKDPWGSMERKVDHLNHHHIHHIKVLDLRSKGLCLVPISCTPQVCRENTGSDYWTPTYRGCLYR